MEELLGKDYPLFYNTVQEATKLLRRRGKLAESSQHLAAQSSKMLLMKEEFFNSFATFAIY